MGEEEAEARAAFVPHDADEAAELDLAEARATRDALLEAVSGVFLTRSLLVGARARERSSEPTTPPRPCAASSSSRSSCATPRRRPSTPPARHVLFRERFADLARLGTAPAARLLDAASGALALAASLTDSRRNVKLATEAFALGL